MPEQNILRLTSTITDISYISGRLKWENHKCVCYMRIRGGKNKD